MIKKILFNGLEDGGIYQFRTSEFEVNEEFEKVLTDFDNLYESYQQSSTLFTFSGKEKKVLIAETGTLRFDSSEVDIYNVDEVKNFIKGMELSDLTIKILLHMIEMEDFSVSVIVEKIAKPGQVINIQLTDTLYGNSEFSLNT